MDNDAQKKKHSDTSSAKKGRRVSITNKTDKKGSLASGSSWGKSQMSDAASEGGSKSQRSDPNDDQIARIFRVTNPDVSSALPAKFQSDKMSDSSREGKKTAPPPSQQQDPYRSESEHSLAFEQGEIDFIDKSEGEDIYGKYLDDYEELDEAEEIGRSRSEVLREMWEGISEEIRRTFDSPCRMFKLRGYHSEPDLSMQFDEKFEEVKFDPNKRIGRKIGKSISYEDIVSVPTKEHPNLVRGILSEIKLRAYAIDDRMENSWRELFELEKKRFSFFDELFAMGYVVDS